MKYESFLYCKYAGFCVIVVGLINIKKSTTYKLILLTETVQNGIVLPINFNK